MGYHSEVAFMLSAEAHEQFENEIEAIEDETLKKDVKNTLKCFTKRRYTGGVMLYHCNLIKWYIDSFDSVTFIDEFIINLDDRDYAYVIIGDDYDDVRHDGGLYLPDSYESIFPQRRVSIPKGGRKCS